MICSPLVIGIELSSALPSAEMDLGGYPNLTRTSQLRYFLTLTLLLRRRDL